MGELSRQLLNQQRGQDDNAIAESRTSLDEFQYGVYQGRLGDSDLYRNASGVYLAKNLNQNLESGSTASAFQGTIADTIPPARPIPFPENRRVYFQLGGFIFITTEFFDGSYQSPLRESLQSVYWQETQSDSPNGDRIREIWESILTTNDNDARYDITEASGTFPTANPPPNKLLGTLPDPELEGEQINTEQDIEYFASAAETFRLNAIGFPTQHLCRLETAYIYNNFTVPKTIQLPQLNYRIRTYFPSSGSATLRIWVARDILNPTNGSYNSSTMTIYPENSPGSAIVKNIASTDLGGGTLYYHYDDFTDITVSNNEAIRIDFDDNLTYEPAGGGTRNGGSSAQIFVEQIDVNGNVLTVDYFD